MLIYTDRSERVPARDALARVRSAVEEAATRPCDHDGIITALIEAGIFEAAAADALCPWRDELLRPLGALRRASEALGQAAARSARGRSDVRPCLASAAQALDSFDARWLPAWIDLRTPEGYAFYALYPEAYADAAREWARAAAPARVVCLGLRGIGASLSAIAHGALVDAGITSASWTIRPHGHPFDRRVDIDPGLLQEWRPESATFLLVDEGPGLSGSSLAGAARFLVDSGVPADRVILLAAWHPPSQQLNSSSARETWARHHVITGSLDRVRADVLGPDTEAVDLSGGAWRGCLLGRDEWPAVHAQHERLKLLAPDGRIMRFAGLGPYGHAALRRAERLAGAGWSPSPRGLRRGFLSLAFEPGIAVQREHVESGFVERTADYIAWLRVHEAAPIAASADTLRDMLLVNVAEALGDAGSPPPPLDSRTRRRGSRNLRWPSTGGCCCTSGFERRAAC